MIKFIRSLFSKKQPKEKPSKTEQKPRGFFGTHDNFFQRDVSEWIHRMAIPVKAPKATVTGFAQDDMSGGGMSNNAFMLGQTSALPQNLFAWYVSQGFIGYQACSILAQHWLIDKACSVAPSDAIRKGYELTANTGEELPLAYLERLKKIDIEAGINKKAVEFAKFNRVFGIRIAVFHVESSDPEYYQKPFNPDGVMPNSYKGFAQVDPYWITPELDADAAANPASRHFYEPTFWRINGIRYHRTHLVLIRTTEVSDVLKPSYVYAGIPLPQRIYERVYAAERTANEAPLLALTKRTTILKCDMDAVMADQESFENRLAVWIQYRDNQAVKVCGTDEDLLQTDTALGDMDMLIMTQYQLVASIANTPATKLLGTVPKGFNSTGDYEESVYHEYLESIQTNEMQPLIERHHLLATRSDPELLEIAKGKVMDITVVWRPIDSMTETELADVQLKKAQTAQTLQQTGALNGQDIRKQLISDKLSGYNGLEIDEDPVGIEGSGDPELDLILGMGAEETPTADAEAPVANQTVTNMTGRQFQQLERILNKVRKGTLNEDQGCMMLCQAFGFTIEQAREFMGIQQEVEEELES